MGSKGGEFSGVERLAGWDSGLRYQNPFYSQVVGDLEDLALKRTIWPLLFQTASKKLNQERKAIKSLLDIKG